MSRLFLLTVLAGAACLSACGPSTQPEEEAAAPARTVLVTGATGTQGGAVARELLERGVPVRALTRNPDQPAARELEALGAEVVRGDYDDPDSLVAAMEGVHGVFAVTDYWEHGFEAEVRHGRNLLLAAERAGVAHFLFSSVAGADADTGLEHFESKYEIEEMLTSSDLDYTILRPVEFMDNWRYSREQLLAGRYVNPRSPTDRHQWIAASDIGFFAGEAFTNPDAWIGRIQPIAGDEKTLAELTTIMSEVFGRPVEHVQVPYDQFAEAVGHEIANMYRWFAEAGYDVNIEALRSEYPELTTVREYLAQLSADNTGG